MAMEEMPCPETLQVPNTLCAPMEDRRVCDGGYSALRRLSRIIIACHMITSRLSERCSRAKELLVSISLDNPNLQKLDVTSPDVKFSATSSSKGGIDIKIGSDTIHVPKHFSTKHPVVQMLLFAEMKWDQFRYPKSLAPKSIVNMFEKSRSSDSPSEYEAGWISASHQMVGLNPEAASEFSHAESVSRDGEPSLPVFFDISTKKERGSTVSTPQPSGGDAFITDSGATVHDFKTISTTEGLVVPGIDSSSTLHDEQLILNVSEEDDNQSNSTTPHDEQLILNVHSDNQSNNTHLIGTSAVTSPAETALVSTVHEHGGSELKYHSVADTVAGDRATVETVEAKASATWVLATASPHHATGNRSLITGFAPQQDDIFVHAADGAPMKVLGCGNIVTDDVVLPDVWYVPGLTTNLVSVSQLSELDYSVGFGRAACYVRSAANGAIVGEGHPGVGGLFEVDFLKVQHGI